MDDESGDDNPQDSLPGTFPTASDQSDNDDGVNEVLASNRTATTENIINSPRPPIESRPAPSTNAVTGSSSRVSSGTTAARVRGSKYRTDELINLFSIMEQIVPIGPDEWDMVVSQHSISYPGRDVDSLRRKYHSVARKSIPTGDPNMPPEVRMAKRCKHLIGAKCSLGGGVEEYNMTDNTFTSGTPHDSSTDIVYANPNPELESSSRSSSATASRSTSPGPPPPVTNAVRNNGLVARSSGKKPDFMEIMLLQMNNEAAERAHERKERAEDRRQMATLVSTIASSFLTVNMRKHKKKKHKRKVVKKKRKNGNSGSIDILSSSSSSSSSGSSSGHSSNSS